MNVLEAMQAMTSRFNPAKARGVNATVQIMAAGDGGGNYTVQIKDGAASLNEGVIDNPNVTVNVAAQDWIDMLSGELDPTMAFMGGKLRMAGDYSVALQVGMGMMAKAQQR